MLKSGTAIVLGLLLAACSGGSSSSSPTTDEPTPAPSVDSVFDGPVTAVESGTLPPATAPDESAPDITVPPATGPATDAEIGAPATPLGEVVINADDLGSAWTLVGFDEGPADTNTDDTAICGQRDGALSQLNGAAGGLSASSRFQQSVQGPFLTTFAVDPGDDIAVDAAFDAFVQAASSCSEFTVEDETGAAVYRIEPASLPTIGDDQFGVVMTVEAGTQTVFLVIAVSRSGDVLIGVSQVSFGDPPDLADVESLLLTMTGRL